MNKRQPLLRVTFLSALLAAFLASCTTTHWEKAGATDTMVDADFAACSSSARAGSSLPALRTTSNAPEMRMTRNGVGMQTAGSYGDADLQLQEAQRVQDCMRGKGYTLRAN